MAAVQMYAYLDTIEPDCTDILSVSPTTIMPFNTVIPHVKHTKYDKSISVMNIGSNRFFELQLQWKILTPADHGTIMSFYLDTAKANGMARTFYWDHKMEDHIYVAQFISEFKWAYVYEYGENIQVEAIDLLITGRKAD